MKCRNWIGTYNNYQTHGVEDAETFIRGLVTHGKAKWSVGQLEAGEKGTPHIQFCVGMELPTRIAAMKKFGTAIHWEPCKDTAASIAYCQKEDSRLDGPWVAGELPKDKKAAGKMGGDAKAERYRDALELAKTGRVYDVEPEILIPHLRNLK